MILPLPAAVLYDAWHVLGVAGPVRRVAPVDLVHAPSPGRAADRPRAPGRHRARRRAARDAGGVHPPGGHVPPSGLRRRGAARPSRDRGVGVQRRRGRDAHADPPGADPRRPQRRRPRARHRRRRRSVHAGPTRSTTGRTCSGPEPSSRARTCGCCSTRSRGSTPARCRTDSCWPGRRDGNPTTVTPQSPRRRWVTGCACSGRSGASTCSRCSPVPTCSRSRAGTRGSASRCSRRWRRAPRWCAPTSRRCARSPATRRASCAPTTSTGGPTPSAPSSPTTPPAVAWWRPGRERVGRYSWARCAARDGGRLPGGAQRVRTSTPVSVTSTVCSNCAVREPSDVAAVQPSGQITGCDRCPW